LMLYSMIMSNQDKKNWQDGRRWRDSKPKQCKGVI